MKTGTVGRNRPLSMGAAEGASSTREWARREARRVGAEQRDRRRSGTVPARGEEARGVWAQGRSRREQGGRKGQSRREGGRKGQSRREQGGRDSPGASWEEGRELGRGARPQGQLWTPISEKLRDS